LNGSILKMDREAENGAGLLKLVEGGVAPKEKGHHAHLGVLSVVELGGVFSSCLERRGGCWG